MTSTQNLKLARLLKVVLDIIYGLLVIASVGLVFWTILYGLFFRQSGNPGTASIPVTIGVGEEPQFDITFISIPQDKINAAYVSEAKGTLLLETNSVLLIAIANSAKLIIAIGLAYIFYLLRAVMQEILDGNPFSENNSRRIRQLGYAVLVVGFLGSYVENMATIEILNRLPATTLALHAGSSYDIRLILSALFILLLARIWRYGLELEREKALTV